MGPGPGGLQNLSIEAKRWGEGRKGGGDAEGERKADRRRKQGRYGLVEMSQRRQRNPAHPILPRCVAVASLLPAA